MASPQRMCIICRKSTDKNDLYRFTKNQETYAFDEKQVNQSRGIYVCESLTCVERLSKHKKYSIPMMDLAKVASLINKKANKLLNSLKIMKNSGFLTFGIELVEGSIGKVQFLIIAKDCNKKNLDNLLKLCKEKRIKYVITASKRELGEVFSKEEINVIGILDKKAAQGLLN